MSSDLHHPLREHLALCEEILALTERENQTLREAGGSRFESCQARKAILPRLTECAGMLRALRQSWQGLPAAERARSPELAGLIRKNQDLVMRILMLDRENQQFLLKRGLVPARHLPPAQCQKPHFVADLYRRNAVGLAHAD